MNHPDDTLEHTLVEEREGTRTWAVWGSTREELLERVTLIFAEHVHDDDDVHIAYNAMQSGWRDHPPSGADEAPFTEVFFEYSALIIVRRRRGRTQRDLADAMWALVEQLRNSRRGRSRRGTWSGPLSAPAQQRVNRRSTHARDAMDLDLRDPDLNRRREQLRDVPRRLIRGLQAPTSSLAESLELPQELGTVIAHPRRECKALTNPDPNVKL